MLVTSNLKRIVVILSAVVVAMFVFSYALVPLYNVMCKQLALNGKTNASSVPVSEVVDSKRTIKVEFLTTNNANLPWDFYSSTKSIEVHPGENTKVVFHAQNNTDHAMTVQAIPSVTPTLAAAHLKKTVCFCFKQQTLQAHEAKDMPVLFHLDTELPNNIPEVTLSYTLFEVKNPQAVVSHPVGKIL